MLAAATDRRVRWFSRPVFQPKGEPDDAYPLAFDRVGTLGGFPRPPATDSARQAELRPRDRVGTLGGFPRPPATDSARQAELRPRDPRRRRTGRGPRRMRHL